jgi:hypothetical protein
MRCVGKWVGPALSASWLAKPECGGQLPGPHPQGVGLFGWRAA